MDSEDRRWGAWVYNEISGTVFGNVIQAGGDVYVFPSSDIASTSRSIESRMPLSSARFAPRLLLLERARDLLRAARTGPGAPVVGLAGMAGLGKTTLALALATDKDVRTDFPNGVIWLDAESLDAQACQRHLLATMGDTEPIEDVDDGRTRLARLLSGRSCLIVLDDVGDADVVAAADAGVRSCAVLVTTRNREVLRGYVEYPMFLADPATARLVLAEWAGTDPDVLPAEADQVIERCGGLPLALAAAGGAVADGLSWMTVADRLECSDLRGLRVGFPGYPAPDLLAAFDVTVTSLESKMRRRYLRLAVFNGLGQVPADVAGLLWSLPDADQLLALLFRRSLVRFDATTRMFTLHSLQFDYVRATLGTDALAEAHHHLARALVDSWGGLSAVTRSEFGEQPVERYGLAHLVGHMVAGGAQDEVHDLLATRMWFGVHVRRGELGEYVRDLVVARRLAEEAGSIGLELRYALMIGSLASMAGTLPWWLISEAVENGIWTLDQALAHARVSSSTGYRGAALASLVPLMPDARRQRLATEAMIAARADSSNEIRVLRDVTPYLSTEDHDRYLADMFTDARASPLAAGEMLSLLDVVSKDRREDVLREILAESRKTFHGHEDSEFGAAAEAYVKLAELGPPGQRRVHLRRAAVSARRVHGGFLRASALLTVAAASSGIRRRLLLREALKAARTEKETLWRSEALAKVAQDHPRRKAIIAEVLQDEQPFSFDTIVAVLPDTLLPSALASAREMEDAGDRAGALTRLAERLPLVARPELLREALAAAREVADPSGRSGALGRVALALHSDLRAAVLAEAVVAARRVDDHDSLLPARAALAARLPEPRRSELLHTIAGQAKATGAPRILQAVAVHLPSPMKTDLLSVALDVVADVSDHYSEFAELAPDLPPELVDRALALFPELAAVNERIAALALVSFVDWLDRDIVRALAMTLLDVPFSCERVDLGSIAARLPTEQVEEMLDAVNRKYNEHGQMFFWAVLAPCLPDRRRMQLQTAVLSYARTIDDHERRSRVLMLAAPGLPEHRRTMVVAEAIDNARRIGDPRRRAQALTILARQLPDTERPAVLTEALVAVSGASAMGAVAKESVGTSCDWSEFWRPVLRSAAVEGRTAVAQQICAAVADIVRFGGQDAVAKTVVALDDVTEWWP